MTAMKHRLQTAEGKAIYSKRKSSVETVFGVIKEVLGFRRFHLRGLRGAEGEWSLVCTAWNPEGVTGVTIPPQRACFGHPTERNQALAIQPAAYAGPWARSLHNPATMTPTGA